MAKNVKTVEEILEGALSDSLKRERENAQQIKDTAKILVEYAKETRNIIAQEFQSLTEGVKESLNKVVEVQKKHQENTERDISSLKDQLIGSIQKKLSEVRNGKDGVNGVDGLDGKNPDPEDVVPLVLKKLPEPEVTKIDKEEILDHIKRIEEELKKVRQSPLVSFGGRVGGGNSDSNVRFSLGRILKKETPSGAINGSNTVYTVTQDIHAVISFTINGEAISDDIYTTSGKTITFTSALPADLSGTSFRIVYA